MDLERLLEYLGTFVAAAAGWYIKTLHGRLSRLEKEHQGLALLVASGYVTVERMDKMETNILSAIRRLENIQLGVTNDAA